MRKEISIRVDDLSYTDFSTARINEMIKNLKLLDDNSSSVAYDRYGVICGRSDSVELEAEDFDALLDAFIASSLTERMDDEETGNPDDPETSESSEEPEAADDTEENDVSEGEIPEKNDNEGEQTEDLSLADELDQLTGLKEVKEKMLVYEKVVNFCSLRRRMNLPVFPTPLHAMFLGSPGTGKTTVAMLMGKMLHKAGLLSIGHVVVRERATLLGQNYNSEAEKTLEAINDAQGGILLIDEAYQLFQKNDPKDPGKFVIETLLTALSDPTKNDWMLILAGYRDEMRSLFEMNPGFKSRIPEANVYTFKDFTMDELMEIAENYLKSLNFSLTDEARECLLKRLASDYAERDGSFGNARHVRNLIETEILPAMAVRVMNEGTSDFESLREIKQSDIPQSRAFRRQRQTYVGFHCSKVI